MAEAVKSLFPEVKVTIGPAVEGGFYYDFDAPAPFTPEDLPRIEARMAEIIKADETFQRRELPTAEAKALFAAQGEPYKVELISDLERDAGETRVSIYTQGSFTDLCRGPHLASTGRVPAFKLVSVAGAYWRGDERNKMLQRIYGTAFFDRQALEAHLHNL
jgi:threonyl-tRNA synthetase